MNSGLIFIQNKMVLTPNGALLGKHYDMIYPEYFAFGHIYDTDHRYYLFGSHDGLTWTELPIPTDSWSGFLCVRNLYVGWRYNNLTISPNAVDWEIINPRETSLGPKVSIQTIAARPSYRDFLIVYKQSSSSTSLQAALTTDFRTFTTIPAPSSSASVYAAGNYYFYSYSWNGSYYFYYFDDATTSWVSFRSNIPDVFAPASYSLNEWRVSGQAIKFDGQYYRIFGRGSSGAWSPIYRRFRAIQSCAQEPFQQWTSTGYGNTADTVVTWTGGAYSLYGEGNTTTPRTIYKFDGANATKYTLSTSGSPRYEIFEPIGDHTYCWRYDHIDIHRIINGTLYEVVFPRTISECHVSCIKLPVYH